MLMAIHHTVVNTAANRIFIHLLCGTVEVLSGKRYMSAIHCVHNLGSPIAPCTLSVRLRMTLMAMHHSAVNTLPPTEFPYTRCTDLHSSLAAGPVRLP